MVAHMRSPHLLQHRVLTAPRIEISQMAEDAMVRNTTSNEKNTLVNNTISLCLLPPRLSSGRASLGN